MADGMFSHDHEYEDLTEYTKMVGFYGNDGVCLFKYFVKNDDPQRIFVWSILAVNFICFFFILSSYLLIGFMTHKSSEGLTASPNNREILKRNQRLNRRISIIITTDFLCWVPFIVICVLHSLEVLDATSWYSLFSMTILPINSVINPFLYDETFTKLLSDTVGRLAAVFTRTLSLCRFMRRSNRVM
jgi:magnesium-transporting ATPase (P-type)